MESMDIAQLKDEKCRRRKKCREKHLDHGKLFTIMKPDQIHKDVKQLFVPKKEKNQCISKKRKVLFLKRQLSGLNSNTDYRENSTVTGIENVTKHNSDKDVLISPRTEKSLKKLKKTIKNTKNVSPKRKTSDCTISKNIENKRKRVHSEAKFSSENNADHKKDLSSDFHASTKKMKIKNKNDLKTVMRNTEPSESDSDEDQVLRNELKGFSIYKNIQKLIQNNPSLVSANCVEEELSETEPAISMSESEFEELPMENNDDSDKDFSLSTSILKNKLVSMKGSNETQGNKNVSVSVSSSSSCNFARSQKNSSAKKDRKEIVSQNVTPSLKNKALEKLQGAKFRYLNEKLYTESGKDSFNYFTKNEDEYLDYHKGYNLQVAKWPLNPVDKIIGSLQKLKKNITIADMGCGDAKIARTLSSSIVYSFDLVALNNFVTPCDISKVPLSNESVDVVIFCLSLMGTNLKEYLQEAYRIAKFGGILKIAEVESRIPNLDQFIKSIQSLGFSIEKKDMEHKLFVFLEFRKIKKKKSGKMQDIILKPCLYKKR